MRTLILVVAAVIIAAGLAAAATRSWDEQLNTPAGKMTAGSKDGYQASSSLRLRVTLRRDLGRHPVDDEPTGRRPSPGWQ